MTVDRWYEDQHNIHTRANAVFMGGGAKGAAYTAALHACASAGVWFRSVAGASAGAITATLVASGSTPAEIAAFAMGVMPRAGDFSWLGAFGLRHGVIRLQRISRELENILRVRVGGSDEPVTFEKLYSATGIALYVVVTDLRTGAPAVFNPHTTPGLPVVPAVVASCTIPGIFQAAQMSIGDGPRTQVFSVSDGGVNSNFPIFVYRDRSFRAWLRDVAPRQAQDAIMTEESNICIGFHLAEHDDEPPPEKFLERPVPSKVDITSNAVGGGYFGGLLAFMTAPLSRVLLVVVSVLQGWLVLQGLPRSVRTVDHQLFVHAPWAAFARQPLVFTLIVASGLLLLLAVLMFPVLGRLRGPVVLAVKSAFGVATGVPHWYGHAGDDFPVGVPTHGLNTLSFRAARRRSREVEQATAQAVLEQLCERGLIPGEDLQSARVVLSRVYGVPTGPPARWDRPQLSRGQHPGTGLARRALAALAKGTIGVVGLAVILVLAWLAWRRFTQLTRWSTRTSSDESFFVDAALGAVAVLAVVLVSARLWSYGLTNRLSAGTAADLSKSIRTRRWLAVFLLLSSALAVGISWRYFDAADEAVVEGTIVKVDGSQAEGMEVQTPGTELERGLARYMVTNACALFREEVDQSGFGFDLIEEGYCSPEAVTAFADSYVWTHEVRIVEGAAVGDRVLLLYSTPDVLEPVLYEYGSAVEVTVSHLLATYARTMETDADPPLPAELQHVVFVDLVGRFLVRIPMLIPLLFLGAGVALSQASALARYRSAADSAWSTSGAM